MIFVKLPSTLHDPFHLMKINEKFNDKLIRSFAETMREKEPCLGEPVLLEKGSGIHEGDRFQVNI